MFTLLFKSLFVVVPNVCGFFFISEGSVFSRLFCAGSTFCGVFLGVLSSLAIILLKRTESWLFYFNCVVAVGVLCVFLSVLQVGL